MEPMQKDIEDERRPDWDSSRRKKCCIFSLKEVIFIIAILIVIVGIEYCYDAPGALQLTMMKYYDLSYYQYSLLFSLYSMANIFHSVIGGFLIDRVFGIKVGTIIYTSVALLGMIFFAVGALVKMYWIMLVGRLVFGIGAEMIGTVCSSYYVYSWFKGSYVNFVFSLSDNLGYFGTVIAYSSAHKTYEFLTAYYNHRTALDLTLITTSATFCITFAAGLTMALLNPPVKEIQTDDSDSLETTEDEKVKITDCINFPPEFWLLCVLYACYGNGVFTIQTFEQDFLVKEFSMSINSANNLINMLTLLQTLVSIPFSIAVDKMGRNTVILFASIILALISHVLVSLSVSPYLSFGLLGISYSLTASTLWPMFAYGLEKKYYGLGYGIASCFQSLSLTLGPMIAGKIIDGYGYLTAEYFYFATLIVSFFCIILVNYFDKRSVGILCMSAKDRNKYLSR